MSYHLLHGPQDLPDSRSGSCDPASNTLLNVAGLLRNYQPEMCGSWNFKHGNRPNSEIIGF